MKVIKPNDLLDLDGTFTRASTGTYFDATKTMQTAAINEPRFNYNPTNAAFEGLLYEPARTNILLNSATLSTQTRTVTAATVYTLSFYGTGTVVLSGAYSSTVVGAGIYPANRKVVTFTTTSTSLVLTVTGSVQYAQLEIGGSATSYIPTTTVAVTRAADVATGQGLIYTDVTDPNALWSSATSYTIGQKVRYGSEIYESISASANLNHQPDISPTWWLDLGADNLHAALDTQISTSSTTTTSMTFVVRPGVIDSMALINMEATIAEVAITDPTSGLVYNSTAGLSGATVYDWYQYFFYDPLLKRTQVIFYNIPPYSDGLVTIRLRGNVGDIISVAQAIFGTLSTIGRTQYGANVGIIDYSTKETDIYGITTFVERAFSKRLNAQVHIDNASLNRVQSFLYSIRAKPSVWIASDDPTYEEALIVYGFYRDFSTEISYPTTSLCSLEIEGLT